MQYVMISDYANHSEYMWRNVINYIGLKDFKLISASYASGIIPNYVLFDGGHDVSPILYNTKNTNSSVNLGRDLHELGIFNLYSRYNTAFIGICRGSQLLNVLLGGQLNQDITPMHNRHHTVRVCEDTNFAQYIGDGIFTVNSTHHQASILSDSVKATLYHFNYGTVEGFESLETISINGKQVPKYKAIQSHPEYLDNDYQHREIVLKYLFSL